MSAYRRYQRISIGGTLMLWLAVNDEDRMPENTTTDSIRWVTDVIRWLVEKTWPENVQEDVYGSQR
jgi:hypothetical protein